MPRASEPDAPHRGSILHRTPRTPSQRNEFATTADAQYELELAHQRRLEARHDEADAARRELLLARGNIGKAALQRTLRAEEQAHLACAAGLSQEARAASAAADRSDAAHAIVGLRAAQEVADERRSQQRACMRANAAMADERRAQRLREKRADIEADIEALDSPHSITSRLGVPRAPLGCSAR